MTARITTNRYGTRIFDAETDDQNTNLMIHPTRAETNRLTIGLHRNTDHGRFDLTAEDEAVLLAYLQERASTGDADPEQLADRLLARLGGAS